MASEITNQSQLSSSSQIFNLPPYSRRTFTVKVWSTTLQSSIWKVPLCQTVYLAAHNMKIHALSFYYSGKQRVHIRTHMHVPEAFSNCVSVKSPKLLSSCWQAKAQMQVFHGNSNYAEWDRYTQMSSNDPLWKQKQQIQHMIQYCYNIETLSNSRHTWSKIGWTLTWPHKIWLPSL